MRSRRKMKEIVQSRLNVYRVKANTYHGLIGDVVNNVTNVPGRTNVVYVTSMDGVVSQAVNRRVPSIFGAPVIYGYDPDDMPNTLQVLSNWDVFATSTAENLQNGLAFHHQQHEFPNADAVQVQGEQFLPGLCYPGTGLTVLIYPDAYNTASGIVDVEVVTTIDLSAVSPALAADECRMVMIVMTSAGAFAVRVGAIVTGWSNLSVSDIPVPSTGDIARCAVKMFYGQTAFRMDGNNDDFIDLRRSGINYIHPDQIDNLNLASANIGGATNYLEIASGGKLSAHGSATWFDDLRVELTVRGSNTKSPTYAAMISGIYAYEFDNAIVTLEKEVNFKMQLPHGWLTASAIHLHVHWVAKSTTLADQKVRWGLEYTKANINGVFGATTTIYATDPASPPSTTPTAMTHYLTEFADIDMTGGTLSNFLLCRLFRNSSNAADTYTDSAYVIGVDAHVEFDQLGSNDEFTK